MKKTTVGESAAADAKAETKIISQPEMDRILQNSRNTVNQIVKLTDSNITLKDAIIVRDNLILISAIKLGRRSKELAEMTLSEVENAKLLVENNKTSYLINIKIHKTRKNGKNANVHFTEEEMTSVQIYVEKLRPLICSDSRDDSPLFPIRRNKLSSSITLYKCRYKE